MKRADIERLLPAVFRETLGPGTPLSALLDAMEALHAPAERALRDFEAALDPRRAPDGFVPFLAGWLDLDALFEESPVGKGPLWSRESPISTGLGRLRELVAAAAELTRWRGTARGLRLFLETATGARGFRIEERPAGEDGAPVPFHIRIEAPAETAPHAALIQRIVELEKPAHVTSELTFRKSGGG